MLHDDASDLADNHIKPGKVMNHITKVGLLPPSAELCSAARGQHGVFPTCDDGESGSGVGTRRLG